MNIQNITAYQKVTGWVLGILLGLSYTYEVYAQQIKNPIGCSTVGECIGKLITTIITLAGIIAIGFIVYGGFIYITSGGDEKQIAQGKKAMQGAIIGLVLLIFSYAIVSFILDALK